MAARTFGFRVRRIGKLKRSPQWGDAVVNEIMDILSDGHTVPIEQELDRIVENWENKPKFKIRTAYNYKPPGRQSYTGMTYKRGSITLGYRLVGTRKAMQIWNWLNLGTRPHKIKAKNAPRLAFRWGGPGSYKPKTTPGGRRLKFGGPGTSSGPLVRPLEVDHPGNEPRDFDGYIQRKIATKFKSAIRLAIKMGLAHADQKYGAIKAQEQRFS